MQYLLSLLEGIVTFISPCLLPMLPFYVSYFAGSHQSSRAHTLRNALGFVFGFSLVFVSMGALAGTVGSFLRRYQLIVNLVTGVIVIFFGLYFLDVFRLSFFRGIRKSRADGDLGFFSSLLFGIVFSVGWTPCVGAFLGSALMLASQRGSAREGILMLLCYSAGLGIPYIISALLIDPLKETFSVIKRHYGIINRICGILLIAVGILMMSGLLGRFLNALS